MSEQRENEIKTTLVSLLTECKNEDMDFQEIMLRATLEFDQDAT